MEREGTKKVGVSEMIRLGSSRIRFVYITDIPYAPDFISYIVNTSPC